MHLNFKTLGQRNIDYNIASCLFPNLNKKWKRNMHILWCGCSIWSVIERITISFIVVAERIIRLPAFHRYFCLTSQTWKGIDCSLLRIKCGSPIQAQFSTTYTPTHTHKHPPVLAYILKHILNPPAQNTNQKKNKACLFRPSKKKKKQKLFTNIKRMLIIIHTIKTT